MKHADSETLAEAERILNSPLPWLASLPDISELSKSLHALESDEQYSIRHQPPPPLWAVVGNGPVQEYYRSHPGHPMEDDNRAHRRRRAAFLILNFARQNPSAFTTQNMKSLHDCIFDCDVSIRHDLVRALGFIKSPTSVESLREISEREPESNEIIEMAALIYEKLLNQ